jgi:hypothetical protein
VPELNSLIPEGWKPPSVEGLEAWQILRGLRWRSSLSQRELAALAGIPQSTVSRIDARQAKPTFDTMCRILSSCGYVFIVARAGRRPPAHLPQWLIRSPFTDPWWGWHRLGWNITDKAVPNHTYAERPRPERGAWYRWNDAT